MHSNLARAAVMRNSPTIRVEKQSTAALNLYRYFLDVAADNDGKYYVFASWKTQARYLGYRLPDDGYLDYISTSLEQERKDKRNAMMAVYRAQAVLERIGLIKTIEPSQITTRTRKGKSKKMQVYLSINGLHDDEISSATETDYSEQYGRV